MTKHTPIFVTSKTAASFLEMREANFLTLVKEGALPPAGMFERWDVEQLRKVMRGDLTDGLEDVEW